MQSRLQLCMAREQPHKKLRVLPRLSTAMTVTAIENGMICRLKFFSRELRLSISLAVSTSPHRLKRAPPSLSRGRVIMT